MAKRMIMGGTDFNTPLVPPKGFKAKLAFWLKGGYANIAIYQAGFNSRKEYHAWLKKQADLAMLDGDGGSSKGKSGGNDVSSPGDTGGGIGGTDIGKGRGRGSGAEHGKGVGHGKGHGQGVGGGRGHK